MVTIVLLAIAPAGHAEVFKCTAEDGSLTFQQTPCPEPEPEPEPEPVSEPGPETEADEAEKAAHAETVVERPSAEVEACKQPYRDAIDAIDLEIQNSYSPEQREYYLDRLKVLTEKMSAC